MPIYLFGELVKTFRDLSRAIAVMAEDERPELCALKPLLTRLIKIVGDRSVLEQDHPDLIAELPPGIRDTLRTQLQDLSGEIATLMSVSSDDDQRILERADSAVTNLLGEVERPRPNWRVMRDESRDIAHAFTARLDPGSALGQLHYSSTQLFNALSSIVEDILAAQPDLTDFRDFSDAPELLILPLGSFLMGSPKSKKNQSRAESPQHEVRIANRFALGRYLVTFEEYDRFTDATGRERIDDQGWGRDSHFPVIGVSWKDAQAYVSWLSSETGKAYRLPSEAEWEYACRVGTTTRYYWGNTDPTPEQANFRNDVGRTTKVNAYPANPWGLHDMHGNLWEWCEDIWHESYEGAPADGNAWVDDGDCGRRVLRGGSWVDFARYLRSTCRGRDTADFLISYIGFRVARTLR